jgi:hypothetical protein
MISDSIKALLTTPGTLADLVGTRVYSVVMPRGYMFPAICYHIVNDVSGYDVVGDTEDRTCVMQIDCYGATANDARYVAECVQGTLNNFTGVLSGGEQVNGTFIERDMDMPFQPGGDVKGVTYRVLLQVRFEYKV